MIKFDKILLGTSPFIAAGQFNERSYEYYQKFYLNPQNITELILECYRLGIKSIQALAVDVIVAAIFSVQETYNDILCATTIGFNNLEKELELAQKINSNIVFIHAQLTDKLELKLLDKIINLIKKKNIIVGCATHNPARTIPVLDDSKLDIAVYLTPLNKLGLFMGKDNKKVVEVINNTPKKIIAKKVLAAGRIKPNEALEYIKAIKKVDAVTIGVTSKEEAKETFSIAKKVLVY